MRSVYFTLVFQAVFCLLSFGQGTYETPKNYLVAGIRIEGAKFADVNAVLSYTGIREGDQIQVPGQDISEAIKKIWRQNIFSDIEVYADKIVEDKIWLVIKVEERPRISSFSFKGVSKSQADDLREKISYFRGTIWSPEKEKRAERVISNYYVEKSFYGTKINIFTSEDTTTSNAIFVKIVVDKGEKYKIARIGLDGNQEFGDQKLVAKMKEIKIKKSWRLWARSKYLPANMDKARENLVNFYNKNGYRDARVLFDTVYISGPKLLDIDLKILEGNKYYFRNLVWTGNHKYNSDTLGQILGIEKGDQYDPTLLDKRLSGDPNGRDISSLYLDDGYLFFNVEPVEQMVEGDSIDIELKMYEGPQATIRNVFLEGNTKTSDYVVFREVRTLPGQKFSRSDMIRSHREISSLGYFNPETIDIRPIPDPTTGTVDLKYVVEEKASDQLQVQGGYQGQIRDPNTNQVIGGGFVGTVSLAFNNFSTKRFFKKSAWNPIPAGDGQKLTLAIQTNGARWQNYYISFLEPWLGGKRPNSLGASVGYTVNSVPTNNFKMTQFSTSLDFGMRLKIPDDFFRSYSSLSYKNYNLSNASVYFGEELNNAFINNISFKQTLDRTSIDQPIYPRSGSQFTLSAELTLPYSLFQPNKDFGTMPLAEKYKFLEYHKWTMNATWYFKIWKNLVVRPRVQMGFLSSYRKDYGISPFERFQMGGSGFGAFSFFGQQFISLRGYQDQTVDPEDLVTTNSSPISGGNVFNKFTLELRQPLTLNQAAPIWLVGFLEAGNNWYGMENYNPFDLKRTAGAGIRVMVPMIGLLGVDWGYGFDDVPGDGKPNTPAGSNFTIIFGQEF